MGGARLDRVRLEELYLRHHRLERLHPDPLVYARGYRDPADGELAGILSAALAYGRVEKILEALETVFAALEGSPAKAMRESGPREMCDRFEGFAYRFHKGKDLALFLHLLRQALDRAGSLSGLFHSVDAGGAIGGSMTAFVRTIYSGDPRPILSTRSIPAGHPVRHLLASPATGGAAKRLCLYLRWMVRRDELDPGYWHGLVDPARLVIPLDTHVARVSRGLGLTRRGTPGWKMACEITDALRRYDPRDPVRYDFSLFRFGMEDGGVLP